MGSTNFPFIKSNQEIKTDLSPPASISCKIGLNLYHPNDIEEKHIRKFNHYKSRHMSLPGILKRIQEKKCHNGIPQKFR